MKIISLLTDFGDKDNFVGVMKAVILKINPRAEIVDICHNVSPQDIMQAAFFLENSFRYFPKGTIHLVVVDPGVGSRRKGLIVKTKNYYYVAPDNGVLALALKEDRPEKIVEITNDKFFLKPASDTFHGRDIFAPVASYLSKGKKISIFGSQTKSFKDLELPKVKQTHKKLVGEVIYIDNFGNLVSNIDKQTFGGFIKEKRFNIFIKGGIINKISRTYSDATSFEPIALFGSFGYLEIAINLHSAHRHFNADIGDKIKIILRP